MIPVNNKIIVRVNLAQKNELTIGNIVIKIALSFETNFREKSPVIAEVIEGNDYIRNGMILCTHHNHFYGESPYHLQDDLYSIPVNRTIFGYFDDNGFLTPLCGNILAEQIDIPSSLPLPPEMVKKYKDRALVLDGLGTPYKKDDIVFTKPSAPYIIVYNWCGLEKRVTKIDSQMIVGVLKKAKF